MKRNTCEPTGADQTREAKEQEGTIQREGEKARGREREAERTRGREPTAFAESELKQSGVRPRPRARRYCTKARYIVTVVGCAEKPEGCEIHQKDVHMIPPILGPRRQTLKAEIGWVRY